MAGFGPAIHAFQCSENVDARDKRGHDEFLPLIFYSFFS
jgi:hypothetical protein